MRKVFSKGFTLVELLIVIGLLGAIALIVIAAINPIEQANRARDARFRADAGQIISAIERYYTSHSAFTWEGCSDGDCTTSSETAYGFVSVADDSLGLCIGASSTGCPAAGVLVTEDELKNEFLGRDFIKATAKDKQIFVGKAGTSSSSVYGCYVPLSKAARKTAVDNGTVRSLSFDAAGVPTATTACDAAGFDWSAVSSNCYVCIPE